MKEVPENELLSAYLDGELTAAEQVEVERLLAASPAARQLLEELRALSSTLQTLPQHKLGEDISQRVLRIAERRMLTEPAAPGELPVPSEGHRNDPPNGRPSLTPAAILRRLLNSRALVWSSLAVVVAVMLMVMDPGRQDRPAGDGIAVREPADHAAEREEPSIREVPKGGQPADQARPRQSDPATMAETHDKQGSRSLSGDTPSLDTGAGPSDQVDMKSPSPEGFAGQKAAPATPPPGGPRDGAAAPSSHYAVAPKGEASAGETATDGRVTRMGTAGGRDPNRASGGLAGGGLGGGGFGGLGFGADDLAQILKGGQVNLSENLARLEGGYVVVFCDLSPTAFKGQAIDRVLAANGIPLEGAVTQNGGLAGSYAFGKNAREPQPDVGQPQEQKQTVAGATLAYLSPAGELDIVCVEAPPARIKATLDALKARTAEFLSVKVEPAPGVEEQKDWGRQYSRGLSKKFRGGEQPQTRPADDSAGADALSSQPGAGGQQWRDVEGKEGRPPLGYALRLRLPESAQRGQLNSSMGRLGDPQSGQPVRQPGPPPPAADTAKTPRPPAGKPVTPALAQQVTEPVVPAERPGTSVPPAKQPDDSSAVGKRPKMSAAPAQPERSAEPQALGERLDEATGRVFGGQALRRSAVREKTVEAEEDAKSQEPAKTEPESAPVPPTAKGKQAAEYPEREGAAAAAGNQAEGTAAESRARLRQGFRQQQEKSERPRKPVAAYRVLFVLRMVGPGASNVPDTAASTIKRAEPPAAKK